MIAITKDFEDYNFLSEVDSLEFISDAESVDVKLYYDDVVILDETYIPDIRGKVILRDLIPMFESYMNGLIDDYFSYHISDISSDVQKSFTIQYCRAQCPLSAREFLSSYFLTTLMGDKQTAMACKEFISYLITTDSDVWCNATYADEKTLQVTSSRTKVLTCAILNRIITTDVSPSLFASEGKKLIMYEIEVGQRKQKYVVTEVADWSLGFIFENSFGVRETFYCRASTETSSEYDRSGTYINGSFSNYRVEEQKIFKSNTGPLQMQELDWLEDLLRSPAIVLLNKNMVDGTIVITSSEAKRKDEYDALPSYSIDYRFADRHQNKIKIPINKTFDQTFDYTFS